MRSLIALLFLIAAETISAQTGTLAGVVRNEVGDPVQAVVSIETLGRSVTADEQGKYSIELPAKERVIVSWTYTGLSKVERSYSLRPGEVRTVDMSMPFFTLNPAQVEGERRGGGTGLEQLDARITNFAPTIQNGVESLLSGQTGVVMRNELSSGYSVRGGNFDENLVYVNDIEVYRPFLVRAGQQEGLSFPNPNLIDRLQFSAGGFEARFGDKLSSVLDITYKRPTEFKGSATAGLLGGSVHLESAMLKKRLRQITGYRYRTNQLIISGLDTKGEYRTGYTDLQTYWTYDLTPNTELGFLGIYSSNKYNVVPQDRETEFGPFNMPLRFTVYFEGQEKTAFETLFGALDMNIKASKDLKLKFTASAFRTYETERFDVLGQYRLGELERDPNSDQFGEVVRDLGVGTFLEHARNQLDAKVYTVAHKGYLKRPKSYIQWGLDARAEAINDKLSEWNLVDSAGFSIPLNDQETLALSNTLKSKLNLESVRASAYLQNTWRWNRGYNKYWTLIAGARAQHWSYNQQTVASPRLRLTYNPGWTKIKAAGDTVDLDYSFWAATGYFYQMPFYREVRRMDGTLNPDIRAQKSVHFLLGMDRRFPIWHRPFKFVAEVYYKHITDLIPYEVSNVRIRYLGTNNAKAYATGLDLKLNGEFIEGVESWVGVGLLQTREDVLDDFYYKRYNAAGEFIQPGYTFDQTAVDSVRVEPGFIPRPADQRVNFALFFQDEMPRWPTFKVAISMVFGTRLPFGPPNDNRYSDTLRTDLYQRVDIGFSKQLLGAKGQEKRGFLRHIDDLWISVEVFNLLGINNTIDHTWVTDVTGRQYSIPDYLTPRRFNLKILAWF
ncbi:MAG: TonB-dependent receptor [Flavobacteriales bacterium]|nr:TonB-dependent receptor [Flavobacteriales bacterium]